MRAPLPPEARSAMPPPRTTTTSAAAASASASGRLRHAATRARTGTLLAGERRERERRRLGQLPGLPGQRVEAGDERRQPLDLRAGDGVVGEPCRDGTPLVRIELAEQQRGDVGRGAHRATPSASSRPRRRSRPCTIRILTVPSGIPVSAAISLWLSSP